jgi:LPXTG-site transpeptidase (sortase) family protein
LQGGSTPQPSSALLKLSQDVYGKRLIEQISIPSLGIETAVVPVGWRYTSAGNADPNNIEWDSPGDYVGWTITSQLPGQAGNIILYGHNNTYTAIFKDLSKLKPGARVFLKTGLHLWEYQVDSINIIPVVFSDGKDRSAYQNLLKDDGIPRLTLVSCWPPVSNTHRVVVTAFPVVSP